MKIAISVPNPVFEAAEQLAQEMNVPRSQLYTQALSAYIGARGTAALTQKLNAVYSVESSRIEPALAEAQRRLLIHETW